MKKMLKLIPKESFSKRYDCIDVRKNKVVYTDGFFIIEHNKPSDLAPGQYDKKLNLVKDVDYPNTESVKPTAMATFAKSNNLIDAVKYVSSPGSHRIGINPKGKVVITEDPDPVSKSFIFFCFDRLRRGLSIFDANELDQAVIRLYPRARNIHISITIGDFVFYMGKWVKPEVVNQFGRRA